MGNETKNIEIHELYGLEDKMSSEDSICDCGHSEKNHVNRCKRCPCKACEVCSCTSFYPAVEEGKDGNKVNAGDTVTLQGKVIDRHSGDQVSIEITPEQRVLVSTAACVKSGSKER